MNKVIEKIKEEIEYCIGLSNKNELKGIDDMAMFFRGKKEGLLDALHIIETYGGTNADDE